MRYRLSDVGHRLRVLQSRCGFFYEIYDCRYAAGIQTLLPLSRGLRSALHFENRSLQVCADLLRIWDYLDTRRVRIPSSKDSSHRAVQRQHTLALVGVAVVEEFVEVQGCEEVQ